MIRFKGFTPLEIIPPCFVVPPMVKSDFRVIPAGFNTPLGFESQRLEFLTGFTPNGFSVNSSKEREKWKRLLSGEQRFII